jgi:hypothetical protein
MENLLRVAKLLLLSLHLARIDLNLAGAFVPSRLDGFQHLGKRCDVPLWEPIFVKLDNIRNSIPV